MADRDHDELLDHVDTDRRRFIGRLVVGSAIASPVVASFSMRGVNAVFAQDTNVSGQVGSSDVTPSTTTTTEVANTTTTTEAANTTTTTEAANSTDGGNTTTTTEASDAIN